MPLADLPVPPLDLRRQVGPTDPAAFDNADGRLLFPEIARAPEALYDFVFDFGCGCGRLARRLIQQQPQPSRYLGIDMQAPLVEWCRDNLEPRAPQFMFRHHDVHHVSGNPQATARVRPFPVDPGAVSLLIAWSVFTHLLQADAEFYLHELARVLKPDGVAVTTWFFFDKGDFPMMQAFQNALFINSDDPTNAVIFDRAWLLGQFERAGLVPTRAVRPRYIRGCQWVLHLEKQDGLKAPVDFPEDAAPRGINRPPHGRDALGEFKKNPA